MPELDKAAKAAPRAKTAASKTTAPAKKTVKKAASAAAPKRKAAAVETVTVEERQRRIAEAAYYLAERSGFRGDPGRYWLVAEAEIDAQLLRERDRRG